MLKTKPKPSVLKYVVAVAILIIGGIIAKVLIDNPPETKRRGPSRAPQMTVEVMELTPKDYSIEIDSFGTVKPRTQSALVAQVSGQITYIADNFRDGGFFEKGELLLALDERDYLADVKVAEASLINAKQALAEEKARVEQAKINWQRLGKATEQPNDLVLRKPQLEAAKATLLSAEAQLDKANLALERTKIVAPFAGRILQRNVDLGQVVANNSQLASVYATDYVEIRLPINNNDLAYIELPEEFRNHNIQHASLPKVKITSKLMDTEHWQGKIIRTESAIDESAQQLYVVAQVDDPYAISSNKMALKINQYVTAAIQGKTLQQVIVIPNKAIYQGSYVYVVEKGLLMRRAVTISWKNETESLISQGLHTKDKLVLTALGQVSSGTPVAISGDAAPSKNQKGMKGKKSQKGKNNPMGMGKEKPPQAATLQENRG